MIYVLGTGRSGTSTVARILHENGFCMGSRFRGADDQNLNGYYEDRDFVELNDDRMSGSITYPEFLKGLYNRFAIRDIVSGLKDPRICHFINEYRLLHKREFGEWPRLVRCVRPREAVVTSMIRCYGWPKVDAEMWHDTRSRQLDAVAQHEKMFVIDFTERKTDDEILVQLRDVLV
jgi:hypothetical protein